AVDRRELQLCARRGRILGSALSSEGGEQRLGWSLPGRDYALRHCRKRTRWLIDVCARARRGADRPLVVSYGGLQGAPRRGEALAARSGRADFLLGDRALARRRYARKPRTPCS